MADAPVAHELLVPQLPAPFQTAISAGPYNFEFNASNRLRLSVVNSLPGVAVEVHYRVAGRDAAITPTAQPLAPTSDRIATAIEWTIGDGYLLNVTAVVAAGAPKKGQTYVKLEALHGGGASATVLGTLLAGYVTGRQNLAWPGSQIESSIEGDGYTRVIIGTQPAAGAELSETVPTGARWQLRSFWAQLITSAAAGTRTTQLTALSTLPSAKVFIPMGVGQAPSVTTSWEWATIGAMINAAPVSVVAPWPSALGLLAGEKLITITGNLAPSDQWTVPYHTVQEWLEV